MRTSHTSVLAVLIAAMLSVVVIACGGGEVATTRGDITTSTRPTTATPDTTPPTDPPSVDTSIVDAGSFALGNEIELGTLATATVEGTDIEVTLIEASGPGDDCADCPLRAVLSVRSGNATTELRYSFSGMMEPEALDKARRRHAHGFEFVVLRIADGDVTVVVERLS